MFINSALVLLGAVLAVAAPVPQWTRPDGTHLICADGVVNQYCRQIGREYKRQYTRPDGSQLICVAGVSNYACRQIGKEYFASASDVLDALSSTMTALGNGTNPGGPMIPADTIFTLTGFQVENDNTHKTAKVANFTGTPADVLSAVASQLANASN